MSNQEVKVSVVVPIYNVEAYIRQCVDSILAQTLTDIEVILINDGSPDCCPEIVDEYAAKDARVVAVHLQNGGYGRAVNNGISLAKGKYIAIVEPDDYIEPLMYESLYRLAEHHQVDVVKSWFHDLMDAPELKYDKPLQCPIKERPEPFSLKDCPELLRYHPSVWTCLYKRDFLNKHNIRVKEAPGAGWTDNPFQVQTLCLAEKIWFTSEAYYHWRRVNVSESDDLKDYRLPFLRSDEIHEWMINNGFYQPELLAQLYCRELSYVAIVCDMRELKDKKDCYARIKAMLQRMDKNILLSAPLNRKFKRMYRACSISPAWYRLRRTIRRIRRKIKAKLFGK